MAWFSELAGKAEHLLNNLDEQTGAALRKRNGVTSKKRDTSFIFDNNANKRRPGSPPMRRSPSPPPISQNPSTPPFRKFAPTSKSAKYQPEPFTLIRTIPADTERSSDYNYKQRRHSYPKRLTGREKDIAEYTESLEVENKVLKNELDQASKDLTALVVKMESLEKDLQEARKKLAASERQKDNICTVNKSLATQLDHLEKQLGSAHAAEVNKLKDIIHDQESELERIKNHSTEMEKEIEDLKIHCLEKDKAKDKFELDLRYANSTITNLTSELEKSNAELKRLEKEWESYKLRSKSMLLAKDKELRSLQEGAFLNEDAKLLMKEIVNLKQERDLLQDDVDQMRTKCEELKKYVSSSEGRQSATERMVTALREAFKDERAARNRVEAQYNAVSKDIKNIQLEASKTIAQLRASLRDKERELEQMRETVSCTATSDTSALNVADYEVKETSAETEKIQYLSEKLIQRQSRIDALVADNNALRIQLQNIESKHQRAMQSSRHPTDSSVVSFHQDDSKQRIISRRSDYQSDSILDKISRRFAVWIRSHPLFRIFIILYVFCLQAWVLAVLFTSTPDDPLTKPIKH